MNKVVTIHLNGAAFQLEEGGYDALRAYLDSAARRLEGNPDREEILADIEQAIADKCQAALGAHKTVVLAREVSSIIEAMGPVEDASPGAGAPPEGEPDRRPTGARRLFRIREGRKIAGVCAGIAAYLDLDVSLVRLAFVVVALASLGAGAVAYLIVALVVPEAGTDAERAAATGGPSTAQDFIRLAREGYYEGMKTFTDKRAHREWRRRFRREMRGWRNAFRHEMGAHAEEWREHWRRHGSGLPAFGIALPLLSVLRRLLALLLLVGLVSLLATGALFGVLLPAGLPVWAAILLLILAYKLVVWPIRAARRAYRWSGIIGLGLGYPIFVLWDWLLWVGFLALAFWLGWHHLDQIRAAIANVPPTAHEAAAAVVRWWHRR
jgi:phage shock protein PspC (stress-responsive transcriptional regulator)